MVNGSMLPTSTTLIIPARHLDGMVRKHLSFGLFGNLSRHVLGPCYSVAGSICGPMQRIIDSGARGRNCLAAW